MRNPCDGDGGGGHSFVLVFLSFVYVCVYIVVCLCVSATNRNVVRQHVTRSRFAVNHDRIVVSVISQGGGELCGRANETRAYHCHYT